MSPRIDQSKDQWIEMEGDIEKPRIVYRQNFYVSSEKHLKGQTQDLL